MRTVSYRLADLSRATIRIGRVGENDYTRVVFDSRTVFDEYPGAIPALTIAPPMGRPYPAVTTREGDLVIWDVTDSDLASSGMGEAQLTFTENGVVCKSCIAKLVVERSITASGEAPDPVEDWLVEANTALNAIPQTIDDALAEAKASGEFDGDDGFSPVVSVTEITDGHRVSVTDAEGTETFDVMNGDPGQPGQPGAPGQPGKDGVSPTVTVTDITDGHQVTITDKNGDHTFNVMNGQQGDPGDPTTLIDDTSTAQNKVWSANKSDSEVDSLKSAIGAVEESINSIAMANNASGISLAITDANDAPINHAVFCGKSVLNNAVITNVDDPTVSIGKINGTAIAEISMPDTAGGLSWDKLLLGRPLPAAATEYTYSDGSTKWLADTLEVGSSGILTKRFAKLVIDNQYSFTYSSIISTEGNYCYYCTVPQRALYGYSYTKFICDKYTAKSREYCASNKKAGTCCFWSATSFMVWSTYSTVEAFVASLENNPITIVFQLETDAVYNLNASEMADLKDGLETYSGSTYIWNDQSMWMVVDYFVSTKGYIDNGDNEVRALIPVIDDTLSIQGDAADAHATGDAIKKITTCHEKEICRWSNPDVTSGYLDPSTNTVIASSDYVHSPFIKASVGDEFYTNYVHDVLYYDSDKQFISGGSIASEGWISNYGINRLTISVANAAFIRVDLTVGKGIIGAVDDAPYDVAVFGDSIFGILGKPYDPSTYAQKKSQLKIANCSFGGTVAQNHWAPQYNAFSWCNLADAVYNEDYETQESYLEDIGQAQYDMNLALLETVDFSKLKAICVAYGTNDFVNRTDRWDNPLNPTDKDTFCGALRYGVEKIQSKYPNLIICLCSPIFRYNTTGNVDSDSWINAGGKKLTDYVAAVKDIANEYHIPFFDHYNNLGIGKLNWSSYLPDGTHFQNTSHPEILGYKLAGELIDIIIR